MAKTKKRGNRPMHKGGPNESDNISKVIKNKKSRSPEPDNQVGDRFTEKDSSSRDGSQQLVRPKGMDA